MSEKPFAPPASLEAGFAACLRLLGRAAADERSPMHTAAFATRGPEGFGVRTVVFRAFHAAGRLLDCHSDIRAGKIAAVRLDPRVEWLFWHPRHQVQLRIAAEASLHSQDADAETAWRALSPATRLHYSARTMPGTEIGTVQDGIGAYTAYADLPAADPDAWFPNFCLIRCRMTSMEALWLSREGHRRARFSPDGSGTWLVP
ncbi:MAG: hypothetical protein NW241_19580 [Bacteroidia bacterium]|nr:hypothetical protein [Bacteroidia bacterium]